MLIIILTVKSSGYVYICLSYYVDMYNTHTDTCTHWYIASYIHCTYISHTYVDMWLVCYPVRYN